MTFRAWLHQARDFVRWLVGGESLPPPSSIRADVAPVRRERFWRMLAAREILPPSSSARRSHRRPRMQVDSPLRHTKHAFRILILLVVAVLVILFGRAAFVPDSWGRYGSYRADNVEQQRAKPVMHGNDASCKDCHAEQVATHEQGAHLRVRCEVCHAPIALHVVDDAKIADMPIERSRELCLRCHQQLHARPKDFPQIQPRQHVDEHGSTWSEEVCIECHQPHSPRP